MASSADPVCDLCDTSFPGWKCAQCDEQMCQKCKEIHHKSKASCDHTIIDLKDSHIEHEKTCDVRETIFCKIHAMEVYQRFCIPCQLPVCLECITSGNHNKHDLEKISDILDAQREMSLLICEVKTESLKVNDALDSLEINGTNYSADIEKQVSKVKSRTSTLHKQIDEISDNFILQLGEKEKQDKKKLKSTKRQLLSDLQELQSLHDTCDQKLKGGHIDRNMKAFASKLKTELSDRLKNTKSHHLSTNPPYFVHLDTATAALEDIFGYVDPEYEDSHSSDCTEIANIPAPKSFKVRSSFTNKSYMNYICPVDGETAWIGNWRGNVSMVDKQGTELKARKMGFNIGGMAVTKDNKLLVLLASTSGRIVKLEDEMALIIVTFPDQYQPTGIVCTKDDKILVGITIENSHGFIQEFSMNGQSIRFIGLEKSVKHLVSPRRILVSAENNIWIQDGQKIVVLDQNGDLKLTYTGAMNDAQFDPIGLASNKSGQVLICDHNKAAVHLVDKDGQFLQYISTKEHGIFRPTGIAEDPNGNFWICSSDHFKVIIVEISNS